MERIVRTGEFYRHFKNKLYQIVAVATHSETGEPMVVYQALYGDYRVYVRPYEMFVSEVDHEKYPEVTQKYRFERVEPAAGGETGGAPEYGRGAFAGVSGAPVAGQGAEQASAAPNPHLLRFLDEDIYEVQMECLNYLEKSASQADLDSIYVVLDMKPVGGTIEEQVHGIRHYLSTQHHFDGFRLRR